MGVWNSHTSVGNILGSLIAGVWVNGQWGLSFVVPGIITAAMGVITFLFLIECEWAPPSPQGPALSLPVLAGSRRRQLARVGRLLTELEDRCVTGQTTSLSLSFPICKIRITTSTS